MTSGSGDGDVSPEEIEDDDGGYELSWYYTVHESSL